MVFSLIVSALCRPPQAALKKYQVEHKSKGESLEKCQAELKKLRRKSQGSKNPSKYGEKEMQVRCSTPRRAYSDTRRLNQLVLAEFLWVEASLKKRERERELSST